MHAYLSKKIGMPNETELAAVGWNGPSGHLAVGGAGGALRVLHLGEGSGGSGGGKFAMNQSLESHEETVRVVKWNEVAGKVTSASGHVIVVWALHDGTWYEQMVNEREGGEVVDFEWSPSGRLIAIAYADGMVIVGQVSGERVWAIQFEVALASIAWSPNGLLLLLGVANSHEVLLHDAVSGTYLTRLPFALPTPPAPADGPAPPLPRLVRMTWYTGVARAVPSTLPSLALAYADGHIQLMRSHIDDVPLVLDTRLADIAAVEWSKDGSLLAVAGTREISGRSLHVVQFYTPEGVNVHTLKVPGTGVTGLAWAGDGLRIALTVGAAIFFVTVRPPRRWAYFGNTLVYAYLLADDETALCFWNTKTTEKVTKYLKTVDAIVAAGDSAVVLTKTDAQAGDSVAILFDAIGNPLASKILAVAPDHLALSATHLVVASARAVYVWAYAGPGADSESPEALFPIDTDPQTTASPVMELADAEQTDDPITAVALGAAVLLVARASGTLVAYTLPRLKRVDSFDTGVRAKSISVNVDGSTAALVDFGSALHLYSLAQRGPVPEFEKKSNVTDVVWGDEPGLLAVLEKGRLYVYRGAHPEDAVAAPGVALCAFADLVVRAVALDELMAEPEFPAAALMTDLESRSLRDTRAIVDSVNLKEAMGFVADNPHPRLWRILAEAALDALDLGLAHAAFVKYRNYEGITFLKRLRELKDPLKQAAEVAAYFGRFDDAEALYIEMGRPDLAINLRVKIGDWFRVVKLLDDTGSADDKLRARAHVELGHYYADRGQDERALAYFSLAHAYPDVAAAAYRLGNFDTLADLVSSLPDRDPLLPSIAAQLVSVGMADEAAAAYVKAGNVKAAVDACVALQRWDAAVQLAASASFAGIGPLLATYADKLLTQPGGRLKAVELYRQAGKDAEAGALLVELARDAVATNIRRAKHFYVLAGVCASAAAKASARASPPRPGSSSKWSPDAKLSSLMGSGGPADRSSPSQDALASAWRGATALHLFMLAHVQLHDADAEAAMVTALRVTAGYEAFVDARQLASLVALTTYLNRYFKQSSLAFIKLETMPNPEPYEELAVEIFKRNPPRDRRAKPTKCGSCAHAVVPWAAECSNCSRLFEPCVATGASILDREAWRCGVCGSAASADLADSGCPVCRFG